MEGIRKSSLETRVAFGFVQYGPMDKNEIPLNGTIIRRKPITSDESLHTYLVHKSRECTRLSFRMIIPFLYQMVLSAQSQFPFHLQGGQSAS